MQKKAQTFFDFIIAYGWVAVVIGIVVIAFFFYKGQKEEAQKNISQEITIECINEINVVNNTIVFPLKNINPEDIEISGIRAMGSPICLDNKARENFVKKGKSTEIILGQCSEIADIIDTYVVIDYKNADSGAAAVSTCRITK